MHNLTDFIRGVPFEGPLDVHYFEDIPNAETARRALAFISNPSNEIELRKRQTHKDIVRMWRAAFRGCIAHGVPVPEDLQGYAQRLGVVFP